MVFFSRFLIRPLLVAALLSTAALAGCKAPEDEEQAASQSEADSLRRLLGILDYVAADYPGAVADGKIVSADEYAEQQAFLTDAADFAAKLPPATGVSATALVADLKKLVNDVASADAVAGGARSARTALINAYGVVLAPTQPPDRAVGEALYKKNCVSCHGTLGDANTEPARRLDPPPRNFLDPEVMADLSPARVYNALTDGIRGTGMASFGTFSSHQRWSLAFYVFHFRHDPLKNGGAAAFSAANRPISATPTRLAAVSDRELVALFSKDRAANLSETERTAAVAYLRSDAPFQSDGKAPMAAARIHLARAVAALKNNARGEARRWVSAAYLEGFEPHEASLRAHSTALVQRMEQRFLSLRQRAGDEAVSVHAVESDILRLGAQLDRIDERLSHSGSFGLAFWASFVVLLREGIEAVLLIALLLGMLRRGRLQDDSELAASRSSARAVHFGWIAALLAGLATWWASGGLIDLSGARRELAEGSIALLAAVVMFSASHFILAKLDAKRRVSALKSQFSPESRSKWGGAVLAFLVVYREVFEVVLFLRAIVLDGDGTVMPVLTGVLAALFCLGLLMIAMRRLGNRLKPAPLLASAGILLCLFAIVFAGKGVRALQEAGAIAIAPVHGPRIEWLGLYPTVQTLVAQGIFLLLLVGSAIYWLRARSVASSAGENGQPVQT